ncbi:MAG: hypothetical protein HW383_217 [Candidatus Magasanikbacteria bacterium]|nr:hypothetical protein [Candidatus Magasanikbacteria bacterium]
MAYHLLNDQRSRCVNVIADASRCQEDKLGIHCGLFMPSALSGGQGGNLSTKLSGFASFGFWSVLQVLAVAGAIVTVIAIVVKYATQ